jgi:hypothetical protein
MAPAFPVQQRWSLDSIDWRAIRSDAVADSEALFYLVAAASFIESTTDRYTRNLIDQFFGDDEITSWLERHSAGGNPISHRSNEVRARKKRGNPEEPILISNVSRLVKRARPPSTIKIE